jgi:hypothetical protein
MLRASRLYKKARALIQRAKDKCKVLFERPSPPMPHLWRGPIPWWVYISIHPIKFPKNPINFSKNPEPLETEGFTPENFLEAP